MKGSRASKIGLILVAVASLAFLGFGITQGFFPWDGVQPMLRTN